MPTTKPVTKPIDACCFAMPTKEPIMIAIASGNPPAIEFLDAFAIRGLYADAKTSATAIRFSFALPCSRANILADHAKAWFMIFPDHGADSGFPYLAFYVSDKAQVAEATQLIETHGLKAGLEAAARADRCRDRGNHLGYCRWRQIERLILLLSSRNAIGMLH